MKKKIYLFTDGSVNPQSKIGFGSYLFLDESLFFSSKQKNQIKSKKFEDSSSTKLELETLLWALDDESLQTNFWGDNFTLIIYTDCQNIIGLQKRREGFEKKKYLNSKAKLIKNHQLYKDFYKKIDSLECEFVKVKGHKKSSLKDKIDNIFTLVDKASREALRSYLA